jgi:osmotically-inducible protein OsmY
MKWSTSPLLVVLLAFGMVTGCSTTTAAKSSDVGGSIRKALDQAGLKDVSAIQDRDKGVVTLGGHVTREAEKAQAESIAKSIAAGDVVAVQIAVLPVGGESDAKTVTADLDKGISVNLDAALIQNKLHDEVKYDVKNGVVTLTGGVISHSERERAAKIASSVPNVQQVVNELQMTKIKATSSN